MGLIVGAYAMAHFLVDFACAFVVLRIGAPTAAQALCVLVYNFCAFALQMPFGLLADRLNRNAWVAVLGCLLVAAAFGLSALPLALAVTAGVGNALFHVGGGVDVMNLSDGRSGALGLFVSPGALGLYCGLLLSRNLAVCARWPVVAVLGAALLLCAVKRGAAGAFVPNAPVSLAPLGDPRVRLAALLLFAVVVLRAYVGLVQAFPWKAQGQWALLLTLALVLGKAAGGVLRDRLGALRVSVSSLGASAVLVALSAFPLPGLGAVLLFNMSMPVTLWALARLLPGAKGFSFGLLTFALFLGYVPASLGAVPQTFLPGFFAASTLLSLALLWAALREARL